MVHANVAQVVVVPQKGGCGGRQGGNDTARLTILLACRYCCGRQQTTMTAMVTVTVGTMTTTAAAAAAKKTKAESDTQTTIN